MRNRFEQTVNGLRVVTLVTGGEWHVNCYVLRDIATGDQIVLDPGDEPVRIAAELTNGGVVKGVLVTHAHHDHVGAVAPLCRELGLPAQVHSADQRLMRHAPMYAQRFANRMIEVPAPVEAFASLSFKLGDSSFQIVPTPGHTQGSVVLATQGAVFTGDTLLREHVGRTDLPGANARQLAESVTALLDRSADDTIIFSGHGRPWTIGEARVWWADAAAAPPAFMGAPA